MLKGTRSNALKVGGYTMGMSLVVLIEAVATLVPADEPMYSKPSWSTLCLKISVR